MMSFDFGDIVLVPFPFTDQTGTKKRPAIVISSATYQNSRPDLILAAVTSQVRKSLSFGEIIIVEWQKAGLLKPSVIKPVFTTVEAGLVLQQLGKLEISDKINLQKGLQMILG